MSTINGFSLTNENFSSVQLQGVRTLEEIIESVRTDTSMGLPRDGTVYQLTSDILVLMEQLLDYMDSVGPLLAQVPLYNNMVAHHITPPEKYKYLLGLYISKYAYTYAI